MPSRQLISDTYRRRARRLRAIHRDNPDALQRGLKTLAHSIDRAAKEPIPRPRVNPRVSDTGTMARHFAARVMNALRCNGSTRNGAMLHYPQRQALLSIARHCGISRFDANLIIAAVQHRAEQYEADVSTYSSAPEYSSTIPLTVLSDDRRHLRPMSRGMSSWAGIAAAAVAMQCSIIAGVAYLLLG